VVPAGPTPARAPAPAAPPPPKPPRPEVAAYQRRKKIPWWAMPVVAGLPVWATVYAFTLEAPSRGETDPLVLGEELYGSSGCAGCHGAQGEGGVGPSFQDGAIAETWPNWQNHLAWVRLGSSGWPGATYGANEAPKQGGMPAHESLTLEELALIVRYEREMLGGVEPGEHEDLVALTDAIAVEESTAADGASVEETLAEAEEPGEGPGGTSEAPEAEG
ncbi:MAG: c-type cytochrome, partial [Acidimicrobiales bacterium]